MTLFDVSRGQWEEALRLIELPPMTRLVALALATYAGSKSGGSARPGNRRLAHELQIAERTVERHLEKLRDLALVERRFRGSAAGRRRLADEYQLTLPDDLPTRVRFVGSPDSGVGSSPQDHPTVVSDDVPQEHPTRAPEHPTPGTEHPTPGTGTPDTGVGPTCTTNLQIQPEEASPSTSNGARARRDDAATTTDDGRRLVDADGYAAAHQTLTRLGADRMQLLLAKAHDELGDQADLHARIVRAAELATSA